MKYGNKKAGVSTLVLAVVAMAAAAPLAASDGEWRPGYLGVGFDVDGETGSVSVGHVVPGSPSALHGVQEGDVLTSVAGAEVRFSSHRAAIEFFSEVAVVGRPLRMTYERDGQPVELLIKPVKRPEGFAERNAARLRCLEGSDAAERSGR